MPARAAITAADTCFAASVGDLRTYADFAEARRLSRIRMERMVFVTDEAGLVTYLSRDWSSFTGQALADARNLGWTRVLHPDDRDFVRDLVLRAIVQRCAFSTRYRLRALDQTFTWAAAGAVPSFGPPGRTFLGFFGSVMLLDEPPKDAVSAIGYLRPPDTSTRPGSMLEQAADHLLAAHTLVSGAASAATLAAVENALRRLGEDLASEAVADIAGSTGVH